MRTYQSQAGMKITPLVFILMAILYSSCGYYDPIRPDDLKSPFPTMPLPKYTGYQTFTLDGIKLEISENDYIYGCGSYLYHIGSRIDDTDDFTNKVHILGSGGDPEMFQDELRITIPYNINSFQFETEYSNLIIYRYDLLWRPSYKVTLDDYEPLTGCYNDKENHTVSVQTNTLRGRYIVGRP
ncbi:hypothetical protein ACFLU5_14015 [Bacteroidota bacterium]